MDTPPQSGFEPRMLFEVLLPAVLLDKQAALAGLSGVVQLYVMGPPREEAWWIDLAKSPAPVTAGEHEAALLTIALHPSVVAPLAAGELDVAAALDDGTVQVAGDESLLAGIGRALSGGMSGMDILYAGTRR